MKQVILLTIVLGLLFVSNTVALEPGDTLWTRTYGGSDDDRSKSVQQTTDGGYVITGWTQSFGAGGWDVYLVKTDADGDTVWTRTYGGSEDDYAYSVQQTTDGGYVIGGATTSFGAGFQDFYLVKTDPDGNALWTRTFGGGSYDRGESVQQTTDGGYIVAGHTQSFGAGNYDFYLVKTDSLGAALWTHTYGGGDRDFGRSVQQTTDGGYIIAGYTFSFGAGYYDAYLVKTDADGDTLWTRTYGASDDDFGLSAEQTADGGYILVGGTSSFGAGSRDVYLIKTDANGDTVWTRTYGGSEWDQCPSVRQTADGGYVVAGQTSSFGAGNEDVYLVKTDANGDTLWTRTYGGSESDYGESVHQTSDGGYIVAGWTGSYPMFDFYLVRVAGEELPGVSIEIAPDEPPVRVPQGGRFGFTGILTNNTEETQITDVWTMAVGPQRATYGPFKEFSDLELQPHQTRTAHFYQHVPNGAPLGFYNYIAHCGDYPSTVVDSSFFEIEVVAGPLTKAGEGGWVLTGSFLEGDPADLPSEFALLSNYPNPFNASTVISYQLPVASSVKLEVYNLLGEKVAILVDSEQEAGYKSVIWEASEVSSGLYFYGLTAGDYTETNRMVLVR